MATAGEMVMLTTPVHVDSNDRSLLIWVLYSDDIFSVMLAPSSFSSAAAAGHVDSCVLI